MGKENRERGIKRERSISSSPGRDARSHMRRDEPDPRRGREDRRDAHMHDDRRERDRYGSGRDGDRKRSPAGRTSGSRRQSFERQERRPPSPSERHPDSSREEPGWSGQRRESYGGSRDRGERPPDRRDSYGGARPADRRESFGDNRRGSDIEYNRSGDSSRGGSFRDYNRSGETSRGGSDRDYNRGEATQGDFSRGGDSRGYPEARRSDSQNFNRDKAMDSYPYSRDTRHPESNRDMHGYSGSRGGDGGRYQEPQHRHGPPREVGASGGQPRTYAEYKEMKARAAKAAAAGR